MYQPTVHCNVLCYREVMSMSASLYKVEEKCLSDKAMDWVLKHPTLTLIILFLIITIAFTLVFQIIYGMCTVESGVMRNFMNNSI